MRVTKLSNRTRWVQRIITHWIPPALRVSKGLCLNHQNKGATAPYDTSVLSPNRDPFHERDIFSQLPTLCCSCHGVTYRMGHGNRPHVYYRTGILLPTTVSAFVLHTPSSFSLDILRSTPYDAIYPVRGTDIIRYRIPSQECGHHIILYRIPRFPVRSTEHRFSVEVTQKHSFLLSLSGPGCPPPPPRPVFSSLLRRCMPLTRVRQGFIRVRLHVILFINRSSHTLMQCLVCYTRGYCCTAAVPPENLIVDSP